MKQGHPFSIIILFLLFSWAGTVFCQDIIFNKVASSVGNSFNFAGITQDINGIMWFSTKSGIVRYDGNQMTTFKNSPSNPNSVISNDLESIFADSDGTIWIGSLGQGLDHFDPMTGIFTNYRHDPNNNASLINDTVTQILRDKQGMLWIGTHGGLERFDQKSNTFFHYRHDPNDGTSLSNNQVRELYEDRQGTLWIGTGSPFSGDGGGPEDGGLNRMNGKTGTFTRYLHDPVKNNSLISNKVSAVYEDTEGVIWVGTAQNGFHKMNLQEGTFERIIYDAVHPEKLSGPPVNDDAAPYEHIRFITQDAAGNYWIGSAYAGLTYFNPASGKRVHFHGRTNPAGGFTDYGAWNAFTSRDGILWISCLEPGGNIYRVNPFRKEIPHYLTSSGYVCCFYEEPDGSLMIGTDQELIYKNDEIVNRYLNSAGQAKTSGKSIRSILEDRQSDLWLGGESGLTRWNKKDDTFLHYQHEPGNVHSLSNSSIFTLHEDKADNLWIGTFMGLNLLDRKTGLFTRYLIYPDDTAEFGKNFVTSVYEDQKGNLWTSSWSGGGVNLLNKADGQFKNYLKGVYVLLIQEDKNGILWACADRGLYKYDAGSDNFSRFSDPMLSTEINNITTMIEDNEGNLWLGSTDGIFCINPEREEIKLFGKNYGVGNNGMSYGGSYKGRDGKLYFGDRTGYFSFDPAQLVRSIPPPEISVIGFRLADQVIKPGDKGPLKESLSQTREIRLRNHQNVFSFDLSVIDYAYPEQNRLFYLLENYETEWHQANSDGKAYYFNIPPGKYTMQIKAVNGYGAWAERKIEMVILPPWWRTKWAYVLYVVMAIAGIFGFDRFQRRRIILAERRGAMERELAQAREIEKAYTELKVTQTQLIQSEKMASLGELTAGIAHEIQNPLNFVNNFAEVSIELIDEMKQESAVGSQQSAVGGQQSANEIMDDIRNNLAKILQHGKRADAIVKGMLQHSRTSNGMKESTDINALADEYLRLAYHGLRAKDKTFNAVLKTDFDASVGKININPQDIGRVILNLITNAFYAVHEKKQQLANNLSGSQDQMGLKHYEPTVSVSTKPSHSPTGEDRGEVEIRVKDNGNGIPDHIKDKIFQPFFTTKPAGQGTGLGLSLSYDIVKAHGGELRVETREGEGTEFTIVLIATDSQID